MKIQKRTKSVICLAVVIVVITVAAIRFNKLNSFFNENYGISYAEYGMNEIVDFGEDLINFELLSGYSIRIDDAHIIDYEEYVDFLGVTRSNLTETNPPEKVCIVAATIFNEYSDAQGVFLPYITLYGVDFFTDWNSELIDLANPVLDGALGIALSPCTSYTVYIVYNLREDQFTSKTWDNIENEQFMLQLTQNPISKSIKLMIS